MGDGDLFLDRLPTPRFLRSVVQQVLELREFLLARQRLDVPGQPRPVVLLAPHAVGGAVEDGADFPHGETPEQSRILCGFRP